MAAFFVTEQKKHMPKYNIEIKIADWKKDKKQLVKIRHLVFIDEQNVPEEMEWDANSNEHRMTHPHIFLPAIKAK